MTLKSLLTDEQSNVYRGEIIACGIKMQRLLLALQISRMVSFQHLTARWRSSAEARTFQLLCVPRL